MKRLACSFLIALLVSAPAFAEPKHRIFGSNHTSAVTSLHHLANVLGIEVSRNHVKNILIQTAKGDRTPNSIILINTAREIGLELLEQNLNYTHLQLLETPAIVSLKKGFDDENPSANSMILGNFIVVEEATEKWVRIFGTPLHATYGTGTVIPRDRFLELWTGQTLKPLYVLPTEARQLLADIMTGTETYEARLKSGVIEFSITLIQIMDEPFPTDAVAYIENGQVYEETGYWHIIYQFDGDRRFYDVKARHKMTFHGQSLEGWQETHHQFRILRSILHVWEKVGTGWKKHPPQKVSPRFLKPHFNPHWWSWPLWDLRLRDLFRFFKPVDVQQVNVENSAHYLLTGRRSGPVDSDIEIWLNPQKDYRPARVLMHNRSILGVAPAEVPGEPSKPIPLETEYTLTDYTYQIEKFEPDIWFPKTVTREVSFSTTDENQQSLPILRKTVMQVHHAIFNIPILEKDLGITPDR
ncbi:hypothetical protein C6500_04615 [Candidatus Poribacteria bacterium]|nr:MAG: hypothetical protein C6500_04615 [Candidatus Poribacteria bacterium]